MYHEYQIIGRHRVTELEKTPKVYRMRLFAKTAAIARNKFWYFMKRLCPDKLKKANGEILACNEIFEKRPTVVKNFAIVVKYNYGGPQETHNMYKEYRDLTRAGAVTQMYQDLASRYRAAADRIQIISVDEIKAKDVVRKSTRQFHNSTIKFPLTHRIRRVPKAQRQTFVAKRPNTHF